MKKRILSLVAALALAATVVTPVNAAGLDDAGKKAVYEAAKDQYKAGLELKSAQLGDSTTLQSLYEDKNTKTDLINQVTDAIVDAAIDKVDTGKVKATGVDGASINVVTGDNQDNIRDNGVKPFVKEAIKAEYDDKANRVYASQIEGIFEMNLKGNGSGDVTFKLDDDITGSATSGDAYAIIIHYTGNASDTDGITSQISKITAGGKVTAHFNSFSPVAIIVTTSENNQRIANTWSAGIGSDGDDAAVTATGTTTVVTPTDATATTTDAESAGKAASSPKTSDNAYALYLILAVAAVAGTTLVATKKTR